MKSILIAAGILLALATTASADITRSCQATLSVKINNSGSGDVLGNIVGQGSCKNTTQANDCRARANAEIDRCFAGAWRDRQKNALAPECQSLSPGSSRAGARLTWISSLPIAEPARLTARMAYAACCKLRPTAGAIQVTVRGTISGDKGCGSSKHNGKYYDYYASPTYNMDCNAWRAQGICN